MATTTYAKDGKVLQLAKNFTSKEFNCKGSGCCSSTKIDMQLVELLQKIRDHFGSPVRINSAYRCSTHNKAVGGVSSSKHLLGMAADITVSGVSPADVAAYAESIGVNGIGLYNSAADGYFVHIDTREKKAFWQGQAQKTVDTFLPEKKPVENVDNITVELPTLTDGSKGGAVRALQVLLTVYGYPCGGYGVAAAFDQETKAAVAAFKEDNGLTGSGLDQATWEKLLGIK